MSDATDSQLLIRYAEHQSEAAFAELVRRYVDLVHSAALRMVCDSHSAEDVAQRVFMALAQNARQLTSCYTLSGWLHYTTRNLATKAIRTEVRRRTHEQQAAAMNELLTGEPEATWEQIAPHLDASLSELTDADRNAVLLRYFERKSAHEMAEILRISDEAAQKRVGRAVERLRKLLAKRGVTVGAGALTIMITSNAVQASPCGLAVAICTSLTLIGPATATIIGAATKNIAMTILQKSIVMTTLSVAIGTGIYQAHQVSTLRSKLAAQQQTHSELVSENQQLSEKLRAAKSQLATAGDDNDNAKNLELLRLRGKLGVLQREIAARPPPQSATSTWQVGTARKLEEMSDVGMTTPEAALQTSVWASINSPQRAGELVYLPSVNGTNVEDVERKRRGQIKFAQTLDWSAVPELTIERIDYHQQKRFEVQKDANGNMVTPGGEFADLAEIYIKYPGYPGHAVPKSAEYWENNPLPNIPALWRFTKVGDKWLQVVLGASPDNLPKPDRGENNP